MKREVIRNGTIGGKPVAEGEKFDDVDVPDAEWQTVRMAELLYPNIPLAKPKANLPTPKTKTELP